MTLTPEEEQLARRLDFDEEVLRIVKAEVQKPLEPCLRHIQLADGETVNVSSLGVLRGSVFVITLAEKYVGFWQPPFLDVIHRLRSLLRPYGYTAFLMNGYPHPGLAIIKTLDQNEILRVTETHGWDFDDKFWTAEELIGKLNDWRSLCDFTIIGADYNNIKLEFITLPNDLLAFAEEVNFMCWELDQVYKIECYSGNSLDKQRATEQLAQIIRETRRLYLWWD